jgi:hypothetical protein
MYKFFSISLYDENLRVVQQVILPIPLSVYECFMRDGLSVKQFYENAFPTYKIISCKETVFNTKLIVSNKNGEESIRSELEIDGNPVKYDD